MTHRRNLTLLRRVLGEISEPFKKRSNQLKNVKNGDSAYKICENVVLCVQQNENRRLQVRCKSWLYQQSNHGFKVRLGNVFATYNVSFDIPFVYGFEFKKSRRCVPARKIRDPGFTSKKRETWECFFSYINKYQDLNIGMNAKPFPNNK